MTLNEKANKQGDLRHTTDKLEYELEVRCKMFVTDTLTV